MTTLRKPSFKDFKADFKDQYGASILASNIQFAYSNPGIVSQGVIPSNPGVYPNQFRITANNPGTTTLTYTGTDAKGHTVSVTEDFTVEAEAELTTIILTPLN